MTQKVFILAYLFVPILIGLGCSTSKSTPPSGHSEDPSASTDGDEASTLLTLQAVQSNLTPSLSFQLSSLEMEIESVKGLYDHNRHATNHALDVWTTFTVPDAFALDLQNLENSATFSDDIESGTLLGLVITFNPVVNYLREGSGCSTVAKTIEPMAILLLSKDKGSQEQSVAEQYTVNSNGPSKFWDLNSAVYAKTNEIAGYSRIITGELTTTVAGPDSPVTVSIGLIDVPPDIASSCSSPPPPLDLSIMATSDWESISTWARDDRITYLATTDSNLSQSTVYESFCQYGYNYSIQVNPFDKSLEWIAKKYNSSNCSDSTPDWTLKVNASYVLDVNNLFLNQFVGFPTTITNMTLEPQAAPTVTSFNSSSFCGFSDWTIDTVKTVTDCSTHLRIQNSGSIGMIMADIYQTISGVFIATSANDIEVLFNQENLPGQYTRITLYSDISLVQPPSCSTLGFAFTCDSPATEGN